MKNNIIKFVLVTACATALASSCIQEILPQQALATKDQVSNAPGSYDNFVSAITSTLVGKFIYGSNSDAYLYDLGYPSIMLTRDFMGQDVVYTYQNWFTYWYTIQYLGPSYRFAQIPWTYYYGWIKSCNDVITLAGEEPDKDKMAGAGIAYAMRAFFYHDLARMFAQKTYTADKSSVSVPIVNETTSLDALAHNPRATNEDMYAFILSDLDKAEKYLADYKRPDITTPNLSVVYGIKARVYLDMGDWQNARDYAKKAQKDFSIMSTEEYTSKLTGFNTPNSAWMLGGQYKSDDPQILNNDADSSWGSIMCIEINPETSGCGYAANYGQPVAIDRHLYESMPKSDCRRSCFVDFAIDELESEEEKLEALKDYTDHPDWALLTANAISSYYQGHLGGLPYKFRTIGGEAGRDNQYVGFCVAVPFMRVEEMYLIEAEAAGRINESEGIDLLTAFAKKRDPNYVYGTHNDAYGNASTSRFINEIWWQRRVEFWGEGLATFDIKRLDKGIIRSYENSNHDPDFAYNYLDNGHPTWMDFCIVQTETNYNYDCTNNPDPIKPDPASPYVW